MNDRPTRALCLSLGLTALAVLALFGRPDRTVRAQTWQPPLPTGPDASDFTIPTSREGNTWALTLFYPTNPIGLRVLDEAGNVLAQTEKSVDWVRVGGSEACGGPMEGQIGWTL